MAGKQRRGVEEAQSMMRGLIPLADRSGYTLDLSQVKPSHQSFTARGFWLLIEDGEFVATFGWKPRSLEKEDEDRFKLAVAFSLSGKTSLKKFVDSCWVEASFNRNEPFVRTVEQTLSENDKQWAKKYNCNSLLPKNADTAMREFPAAVISATIWNGRGYLEFLEISSSVVRTSRGSRPRDSDPVHSLAIVVMPPKLLYAFLIATKNRLEELPEEELISGIPVLQ